MEIIVGLGNPGEQYKNTRHNIGFVILDALAKSKGLVWEYNKKFRAQISREGEKIYVKPETFMNNSGQSVQAILSFYKLLPKKMGLFTKADTDLTNTLTLLHDDLDIMLGSYKLSIDSRSAGHRGVESVINSLKTKKFRRFRIGIKTAMAEKIKAEKFVLEKFKDEEMEILKGIINSVIKEIN